MDLLIKQLETKRSNGEPEEAKVAEIFNEDDQNFRAEAESKISEQITMTMVKVAEASEELDLEKLTHRDTALAELKMDNLAEVLQKTMKD